MSKGVSPYVGLTFGLLTQHEKEHVLDPILRAGLGARVVRVEGFDTDLLGTFTGERARVGTQREAARQGGTRGGFVWSARGSRERGPFRDRPDDRAPAARRGGGARVGCARWRGARGPCERYGLALRRGPVRVVQPEAIPPGFRGPGLPPFARAVADGYAGPSAGIDAAVIGRAAGVGTEAWAAFGGRDEVLQLFKQLWHAVVAFCREEVT